MIPQQQYILNNGTYNITEQWNGIMTSQCTVLGHHIFIMTSQCTVLGHHIFSMTSQCTVLGHHIFIMTSHVLYDGVVLTTLVLQMGVSLHCYFNYKIQ